MRIGVISDTHLPGYDEGLQRVIDEHFRDCEMILHAGDLVDVRVLDMFHGKQVRAVRGNMDPPSAQRVLPVSLTLQFGPLTLALIHGGGAPEGLEDRLVKRFSRPDCLVYGHTHVPANQVRDGVFFFNPGSPLNGRRASCNSIGILEISDTIRGNIIIL